MVLGFPKRLRQPGVFHGRDALAYLRALPRLAPLRQPVLPWSALARISALDMRALPPVQWFECADGERLAYRSYGAPAGLQLVLIHGAACFGDQFHGLARTIAGRGAAAVHTLDMRGHGLNRRVPARWRDPAGDIGQFARALRRRAPGNRVVVGGHSAGGGLVCRVARSAADGEVAGWLLLAPYLAIDSASVRPFFGGWLSRIHRLRLATVIAANLLGIRACNTMPLVEFSRVAVRHDPRFVRQWSFDAIATFGPGSLRDACPIPASQPVLLLCGGDDECFRPEHYPDALRRAAGHAEIQVLPGLGHWDLLANAQAGAICAQWLAANFNQNADYRTGDRYVETI